MVFTSIHCKAIEKGDYKLKGLNDEIFYKLCGTWSFWGKKYTKETVVENLGWGQGRVGQDTLIIDFGDEPTADTWYDPPAIIFVGDPPLKILSIETIGDDVYRFNVQGKIYYDKNEKKRIERKATLIIHTNEDETMWIEKSDCITSGKNFLYYKISGPERPEK